MVPGSHGWWPHDKAGLQRYLDGERDGCLRRVDRLRDSLPGRHVRLHPVAGNVPLRPAVTLWASISAGLPLLFLFGLLLALLRGGHIQGELGQKGFWVLLEFGFAVVATEGDEHALVKDSLV